MAVQERQFLGKFNSSSDVPSEELQYEQLMSQLNDLVNTNRALKNSLHKHQRQTNSILILSSLMMLTIITVYTSHFLSEHFPSISSAIVPYDNDSKDSDCKSQEQWEVAQIVAEDDPLKILFYTQVAARFKQIDFDAKLINSDFVLHNRIGGKKAAQFKMAMTRIPLIGAAYVVAEMGAGLVRDMMVLNKMCNNVIYFEAFKQQVTYQEVASRMIKMDYVQQQLNDIKVMTGSAPHPHKLFSKSKHESHDKENVKRLTRQSEEAILKLANKYSDYLTNIVGSGTATEIWKACLVHNDEVHLWEPVDIVVLLAVNHPKGRHKYRFAKNRKVDIENNRRLEQIKMYQQRWNIPKDIMDILVDYWNKFGTKQFAAEMAEIANNAHYDITEGRQQAKTENERKGLLRRPLITRQNANRFDRLALSKDLKEVGGG